MNSRMGGGMLRLLADDAEEAVELRLHADAQPHDRAAFANARRIVEWEREAGIFVEHSLQSSLIQADHLRGFLAAYYV